MAPAAFDTLVRKAQAANTTLWERDTAELDGLLRARIDGFATRTRLIEAFAAGAPLHHLAAAKVSLEQAFMELTADSVEYHAALPVA